MRKVILQFAFFAFIIGSTYGEAIQVAYINKLATTYDSSNIWKYSPLKALDHDDSTCFAIARKDMNEYSSLVIGFTKDYEIDGLSIEGGFFDGKYYKDNYRIKKLEIIISKSDAYENDKFTFLLVDEMKAQYLKFPKRVICKTISFRIIDVYDTNKDKDICISELSFSNKGKLYDIDITTNKYSKSEYTYDEKNRIVEISTNADHVSYWTLLAYKDDKSILGIIKTSPGEEGCIATSIISYNNAEDLLASIINPMRDSSREIKRIRNGDFMQVFTTCIIDERKREIVYYYYKQKLISDTYGEYIYQNGILKCYFAYSNIAIDDDNEHDSYYFSSFELSYNEIGLIDTKYYNNWYAR